MKSVLLVVGGVVIGAAVVYFLLDQGANDPVEAAGGGATAGAAAVVASPGEDVEPSLPAGTQAGSPSGPAGGVALGGPSSGDAGDAATFGALMRRVFSGDASDEEQLAFWEQARKSDALDRLAGEWLAEVEKDAEDVPGRLALAEVYVAKLLAAPSGPERGLLAAKADGLWREVLALEPENWNAQYNIAFSLSQYPDFLNRTEDAVHEYERVLELQQDVEQKPYFAKSYVELARLHQRSGYPARAMEVLELGATVHPENEAIAGQMEKLRAAFVFEDEDGGGESAPQDE